MVSLLKKKKKKLKKLAKLGLKTGHFSTGSSQELLITLDKSSPQQNGISKKKKKRNKAPPVEPVTTVSSLSLSVNQKDEEEDEPSNKKPKLSLTKKKLVRDKLLQRMLKKKTNKQKPVEISEETDNGSFTLNEDGSDDVSIVEENPQQVKGKRKNSKLSEIKFCNKDRVLLLPNGEGPKVNSQNLVQNEDNHLRKPLVPELPAAECRESFVKRFRENDTLIVVGETGCGKSTQIPQYLFEDCSQLFTYRGMAITQPRRVAAISLANRVSYELGTEVGDIVGFKVRFDKQVSDKTKITFLTDGYLMMDAIRDKTFREYSVIIVDEAHERSVETDVVLSLLRNAQILRKNLNHKKRLKLIIMSATLDVDKFKSFYDLEQHGLSTKAVYVKGRPYSLQLNYLPMNANVPENHSDLTWVTLLKLHLELPINHHILVFLTGKEEIDQLVAKASAINPQKDMPRVCVCPLYAALSKETQMKSFEMPPENTRKIVVSTNLAETSLTIPGIRVVIDSGRVKSKYFEEKLGMNVLRVQLISKSQADQRAGRAGREFEGAVYRLYKKADYDKMEEFPLPEITRSNLSRILLLAAVSLGINNFKDFPLPDAPSDEAISYALKELHQYGAIAESQQPLKLTRTAKRLLSFPVELHLAKVLYLAVQYNELSRICAIVAISTVESVYNPDIVKEGEIRHNKYQTLWAPEGDFITYWKILKEFKKSKNKKGWCREYGIQFRTMVYVVQVWKHLLTVCQNMAEELEDNERLSCGDAIDFNDKAHLIFKTAFSHQIAKLSKAGTHYVVENPFDVNIKRFPAKIHPSSSLIQRKPARLMFTHLSLNESDKTVYMHNCGVL